MSASLRNSALLLAAIVGPLLLVGEETPVIGPYAPVSTAHAVIGRPLTPMSYAGVARRTTRRTVAAGAAMGAVAAPVVVAPAGGCTQVADAYGRLYTRCY